MQAGNAPLPPAEKAPVQSQQPLPVQKMMAGPTGERVLSPRGRGPWGQQPARRQSRDDAKENVERQLSPDQQKAALSDGKPSRDTLSSNRPPRRAWLSSAVAVVAQPAAGAGASYPQKRKGGRPHGKGDLDQDAHLTSARGVPKQTLSQVPKRLEDAPATEVQRAHQLRTARKVDDEAKETAAAVVTATDLLHDRAAKKQRGRSRPSQIGSGSSSGVAAFQTLAKVAAGRADEETSENIDEMDIQRQIAMRMGKHRAKRKMAAKKRQEEC